MHRNVYMSIWQSLVELTEGEGDTYFNLSLVVLASSLRFVTCSLHTHVLTSTNIFGYVPRCSHVKILPFILSPLAILMFVRKFLLPRSQRSQLKCQEQ